MMEASRHKIEAAGVRHFVLQIYRGHLTNGISGQVDFDQIRNRGRVSDCQKHVPIRKQFERIRKITSSIVVIPDDVAIAVSEIGWRIGNRHVDVFDPGIFGGAQRRIRAADNQLRKNQRTRRGQWPRREGYIRAG